MPPPIICSSRGDTASSVVGRISHPGIYHSDKISKSKWYARQCIINYILLDVTHGWMLPRCRATGHYHQVDYQIGKGEDGGRRYRDLYIAFSRFVRSCRYTDFTKMHQVEAWITKCRKIHFITQLSAWARDSSRPHHWSCQTDQCGKETFCLIGQGVILGHAEKELMEFLQKMIFQLELRRLDYLPFLRFSPNSKECWECTVMSDQTENKRMRCSYRCRHALTTA